MDINSRLTDEILQNTKENITTINTKYQFDVIGCKETKRNENYYLQSDVDMVFSKIDKAIELILPLLNDLVDNKLIYRDDIEETNPAENVGAVLIKAQSIANETIKEAEENAKNEIEASKTKATEILNNAENRASKITAEASQRYNELLLSAKEQSDKLKEEAQDALILSKVEASKIIDTAETEALQTMENTKIYRERAEAETKKLVTDAIRSLKDQAKTIKDESENFLNNANKQRRDIYSTLLALTIKSKDVFEGQVEVPSNLLESLDNLLKTSSEITKQVEEEQEIKQLSEIRRIA